MKAHYSSNPEKLRVAVIKSKETILTKYGDGGYSELRRGVTNEWYKRERNNIIKAPLVSKEEVSCFFRGSGILKYKGKAGSRKLKRENISIYKSLNVWCEDFREYYNNIELPFLCKVQIAISNFQIARDMLCYCGKRLKFDPKTQLWSKLYCVDCRKTGTSKQHFKFKYGEVWESMWHIRKLDNNSSAIMRGLNETAILNDIEVKNNIVIDRNFRVLNFYPDGYCKETNTIYEVYEPHHKSAKYVEKDNIRQRIIQDYLKCNFCIIWDTKNREIEMYNYV